MSFRDGPFCLFILKFDANGWKPVEFGEITRTDFKFVLITCTDFDLPVGSLF